MKCDFMLPFEVIKKAHDNTPSGTNACQALSSLCEVFHPGNSKLCVAASSTPFCHNHTESKDEPTCKYDLLEHGEVGIKLKTWAMDTKMNHLRGDINESGFDGNDYHDKPKNKHNGEFE